MITFRKLEKKLDQNKVSTRQLTLQLGMSPISVLIEFFVRMLPVDHIKHVIEPALTEEHKEKRKKFNNSIRTNFPKQQALKILFADEKMFDIDGVYNS